MDTTDKKVGCGGKLIFVRRGDFQALDLGTKEAGRERGGGIWPFILISAAASEAGASLSLAVSLSLSLSFVSAAKLFLRMGGREGEREIYRSVKAR